jgi:nitroimidazol reductase NimA-like FMN-containing flavoprotein (pyridoxamine 5'-phosphate oxidase superfamily)
MTSPLDRHGIAVLDVHQCLDLLRNAEVGRLAVVVGDHPDIFPVNYVVDHGTVMFRTAEGSKLAAVIFGGIVAFEVDGYDAELGEAWSVVVKGHASEVRDLRERVAATSLPLFPWQTDPKPRFVRIVPIEITGRHFAARRREVPDLAAPPDPAAPPDQPGRSNEQEHQ